MYNTLIFDLDDTLTNDRENMKEAFKVLMNIRNEEFIEDNFNRFYNIDKYVWKERSSGRLLGPYEDDNKKKTEWIRAQRFIMYYGENNISYNDAVYANNIYMNGMKEKVVSRDGTYQVLEYLFNKGYRIIIATNGPIIPLNTKLKKLNIKKFVEVVFSAEEVGFMKPNIKYYEGLFKKANITSKENVLFIGDELEKDVKGANENQIDICWCNYNNEINDKYSIKYEIHDLKEIIDIL